MQGEEMRRGKRKEIRGESRGAISLFVCFAGAGD